MLGIGRDDIYPEFTLTSEPTAAPSAAVPGIVPVSGVPLEVPLAHPADVRLLCHSGVVRPLPRPRAGLCLCPAGGAGRRQQR